MSLVNEDGSSAIDASESINESEKKPRISYTRDFLLSLSELEICKKLPSGFDQSILSELEENSVQERTRTHGSLPLQGFRRNDYSSSPPTRGDSSNFSRGAYGRWDNRSSGWSDKDGGDSQSDLDPDSGRRNYGNNQSRRPWQNSEHDGLLGSGSFPRPSGFAPGTSAPKTQSNDHFPLSRSNEAYQPPRPFKAIPHARTNTHDSFNDETFGSSDIASQDRAEEERKRRASFELMRKEQQKVLQEKQKSSGNKVKSDGFTDMIMEESKEEGVLEASGELNSTVQSVPNDDFGKSSVLLQQSSKPRPLVPPGFRTTITTKPVSSTDKENPKPGIEEIHLVGKGNQTQNGTLDNIQSLQDKNIKQGEAAAAVSNRIPVFPEVHEAVDGEVFELNKILSNSTQESSTSILGKFFGSTPGIKDDGSAGFLETQKSKPVDPLSQSSRFAQWFNEDEKKHVDDHLSSTGPNDLLSLIVGGDKTLSDPTAPFGVMTKTPSDPIPNHLYNNNYRHEPAPPPPPPVAAVLTCEDLEQTILSEYTEKAASTLPPPAVTTTTDWAQEQTADAIPVDNNATHHLLSLLQKGTTVDDLNMKSENHAAEEKPKDETTPSQIQNQNQNLSLEALFGTAFMKELQSAQQAPVSAQRGPAARIDLLEPLPNGPLLSSSVDGMGMGMGVGPNMTNYENNNPPLSSSKQKQPESWLNLNNEEADPLEFRIPKPGEFELPEEESLMSVLPRMLQPPSDTGGFDISAALNSGFRGERFVRGATTSTYDMLEPERQFSNNNNLHHLHLHPHPQGQGSSPQMNQIRRPMFHHQQQQQHPLDRHHPNSQMRFPEQQQHLSQQFPFNHHHRPDTRVTGFDVPGGHHPQMLPPQMRMQGNFPPPQLMRDHLPRPFMGGDREAAAAAIGGMHGFPFAGVGEGGSGSNHPEAFQMMLEMELRAQAKQQQQVVVRPLNSQGSGGSNGGMLDMGAGAGFRYR